MTKYGDIKYYWQLHVIRMKALGENPTSYPAFSRRLRKMNLHDAIYTPRVEYNVRDNKSKTPIQDNIRRKYKLREENIQILDFDEIAKIEQDLDFKSTTMPKYNMKPKRSIWKRFIGLFRK